jgi:autotransporter adhesin
MNRIYRIVWNATISRWVVASEVAKGRKKKSVGERTPQGAAVMFAATMMVAGGTLLPQTAEAGVVCNILLGPCKAPTKPAPSTSEKDAWAGSTHRFFRYRSGGADANPVADRSLAAGGDTVAGSSGDTAVGSAAKTALGTAGYATAVGSYATVTAWKGQAFGHGTQVTGEQSVGVGNNLKVGGSLSTGLGSQASTAADGAVALGAQSTASHAHAVALGDKSTTDRALSVSVGAAGSISRNVTNVARGYEDSDAVNVSQLAGVTRALGGGAGVGSDGTVNGPTYQVAGGTYDNVGDALAAVQGASDDALDVHYDGANRDRVSLAGANGTRIANLQAGQQDTEALNVSQLRSAGFELDGAGQVINDAVTYQAGSIESGGPRVVLAPGAGNSQYFVDGDRAKGALPKGTLLSNVADGIQDTDAANIGQVKTISARTIEGFRARGLILEEPVQAFAPPMSLAGVEDQAQTVALAAAPSNGSNIDSMVQRRVKTLENGNWYIKVAGRSDAAGSTGPTDQAQNAGVPAAIAVGSDAATRAENGMAMGVQALVTVGARDAVALGAGSVANEANTVSVGSLGRPEDTISSYDANSQRVTLESVANTRRIVNMAAGRNDNDAVNVTQLKELVGGLGGGAALQPDGTVTRPTYEVDGNNYDNVGDALNAVTAAGQGSALSVKYTGADKARVALEGAAGTTISNVKAAAADTEAVNLKQLKDAGLTVDNGGNVTNSFVAYDAADRAKITLGGNGGTTLGNVKAGVADQDAVNVKQLKDSGIVDNGGNVQKAVLFNADGTDANANADGKKLANLAAGSRDADAVNLKQLKDAGLAVDNGGNVTNSFVTYDAADKAKITLGGTGGTTIGNVKAGVADQDAVNVKQLKDSGIVDNGGNVQKAVLFNADGTAANANADGKKLANLAAGTRDADAVNLKQLKDAGFAVDDGGNVTGSFVAYDAADKTKVTLAGTGGTTIGNVKAGVADQDAVNVKQLKDSGIVDNGGNVQKAVLFNADGTEANANADGKKLANLAAGTRDADAVNLKQLKDAGFAVDGGGNVTSSFVAYDAADKTKVTFAGTGGTTLSNVKAAAADTEAVNLKQLKDAGLAVDNGGNVTNSFVAYDAADKAKITLGGNGGTTIGNVKAGVADQDAVNVKQLKDTGLVDNGGNVQKAVLFNADGTEANANADGKKLANLAAGSRDADAVNLKQLKDAGLAVDNGGNVTNSFVAYDAADKAKITLGGADGTTISNVKAAVADTDAVNLKQLKDTGLVDNGGNVQKAVLFNADGADANANADGKKLANLAAGSRDADAVNLKQLKDAGLAVDNGGNVTNSFVTYDAADKSKITLGGTGGTTIGNVKAGVADQDAVNVKQLKDTGLVDSGGNVQKAVLFNADGTAANANAAGKKLANLASGSRDTDAVNLKQLKDAGLAVDGNGTVTNSFVAYDSASKDQVTLAGPAGTTLSNVRAGVATTDAVNVGQLQGAGLIDGNSNIRKAVLFDGPAGEANVAGQRIVNVKAGTADTDGANIKQLKDAGLQVDPTTGNVTNGFVAYDAADKGKVTLRGTGGTTLANVKAATANDHAVNLAQLKDAGIAVDPTTGKVTNAAVIYDDATKRVVTLGGGAEGTTLRNLRAGVANTDAVNVSQIRGLAETLGGGAGVGSDGSITRPTYTLNGNPYNNVGDALDDLDRRTGENTRDIADLKDGRGIRYFRANSSAEDATAAGTNSVAMGPLAEASGTNALAAGMNAIAGADNATAVGYSAEASATGTTALGTKALASQAQAVAVGSAASAGGARAVAVGSDAIANVDGATSLGANATATAGSALALGTAARASHANAVALGAGSTTDRANSVAVGNASQARQVTYVGAGTADTDAVNIKQLKDAGLAVDNGGNVTNSFVAYDAADKAKITLGGTDGTTIGNVKAGVADLDAVNLKQLKDSGIVDNGGNVQRAVLFNADGTEANANADGKKLANLAAGSRDADAVNLKQLKDAGLAVDNSGNVTNSFVTYDAADKAKITLGGADGTTISNVKAAVADTDAVNLRQLKDTGLVDNGGNVQKAVLFNADGTEANANADGKKLANLAAGSRDADAVNLKQLKDAGLTIDNGGNVTNSFVTYDAADKAKITLGGTGGTTIGNVKAGVADLDAVNVKQLKDSGIVDNGGNVQKAVLFNADGTAANANADGKKLANLAAGTRDADAVNLKQLKDAGFAVDDGGNVTSQFVAYDAADKAKVTLAGVGGTTVSNVKAGAAALDAVNVTQLKGITGALGGGSDVDANGAIKRPTYRINDTDYDNVGDALTAAAATGGAASALSVRYTDATKARVALEGAGGSTLGNLKAGLADQDAVNIKQLKDAGFTFNNVGGILNKGITYTAGTIEAGSPRVDLEPGVGNSRWFEDTDGDGEGNREAPLPKGTRITNVADAIRDTDAVNLGQVKQITLRTFEDSRNATQSFGRAVPAFAAQGVPMSATEISATEASGSGVDSAGRNRVRWMGSGNSYMKVTGRGDTEGGTPPTDSANTYGSPGGISIGSDSAVSAENTIAFGTLARANARDSIAIGAGSVADQENTVSVGSATDNSYEAWANDGVSKTTLTAQANTRRVVNMAAGQGDNDAVNVAQLKQTTATLGGGAEVQGDGSVKGPAYNVGGNTYNTVGDALSAVNALAASGNVLGIVYDDEARTKVSLQGAEGTTLSNVKAGVADTDAVNVSQLKSSGLVDASGNAVVAVTYDDESRSSVTLGGKDATAPVRLRNVAEAQEDTDAVNLKQLRSAGLVDGNGGTLDAVVYDGDSAKGRITFGGANGTVLTNVADGRIATGSRDAVNGGQIAALRDSFNSSINGLDGRVSTLETKPPVSRSAVVDPYVDVKGPGSNADAGSADSGNVAIGAGSQAQGSGGVAIGNGAQVTAEASNSVALGQGAVADRPNSVSVGAPGSERTLTNVADGVRDTDVATVRQVNQAQTSAKEYTDTRINDAWNTISRDMDDMNRQVNRGIAASAALINVTPYLPGRTALNAGVSSYRGEAALGVGLSRWSDNGRVNFNAGISAAKDDEPIYRVGMGIVF